MLLWNWKAPHFAPLRFRALACLLLRQACSHCDCL
jgi:hypothetical protein